MLVSEAASRATGEAASKGTRGSEAATLAEQDPCCFESVAAFLAFLAKQGPLLVSEAASRATGEAGGEKE